MQLRLALQWVVVSCLTAIAAAGCQSNSGPREDETTMDMRQIAAVFESIQGFNNRPPKTLDEIKKFLADLHIDKRCDEPDKVLTSSRDGQPYVIVLGATFGSGEPDEIIIFEKTGAEGTRYTMNSGRIVQQLTDAEFQRAKFAKGFRPSAP